VDGLPLPSTSAAFFDLPRDFGEYELLEEIARGGMGVVYRARQRELDRLVAIKLLLFGPHASPEHVKRFRAEASAAASLQHANIVTIHHVGVQHGEHFLVMDLVDGPNLASFIKDKPLPARRAASYLKTIAEAIHYAHEQGILHRDLKPSNILIDANDQPRVTDFGLAKRLEGDTSVSLSGHILGTPSYTPPEQARASHHKIGRRSDVYSLGAMLYHMLVGRPPFVGDNVNQTLDQVFNTEPVATRLLNPAIPRDLETICLKCLEKEPARRYPTAQALAEELGRFLRDEPILAHPVSAPEKVWRWCRRKPALASLVLLVHAVGLVGLGGILWEWRQAEQNLYVANIHLASEAMNGHDRARAHEFLRAIERSSVQRGMRGWEWRYLAHIARNEEARVLGRHDSWPCDLAVTADGRKLATISEDGVAKLWDVEKGKVTTWSAHANQVQFQPDWLHHAVIFIPDGSTIITAGEDGAVRGWSVEVKPQQLFEIPKLSIPVNRLAISPDGRMLAGQARSHRTYVWRLTDATPDLIAEFKSASVVPCGTAFSPDGRVLLVGWADQPIKQYDFSVPGAPRELEPLPGATAPFAFSPDGKWLATCGATRHVVRRWSWPDMASMPDLSVQGGMVDCFAFSSGADLLVSGLLGGQINIWGLTNREPQVAGVLYGHEEPIAAISFMQEGNQMKLASISNDKTVRLWDIVGAGRNEPVLRMGTPVLSVGISPDGGSLATVTRTSITNGEAVEQKSFTLQLRDLTTCSLRAGTTFGAEGLNPRLVFAPNGREIGVTDFGTLEFHNLPSLEPGGAHGDRGLVYAPGGRWLAYIRDSDIMKRDSLDSPEQLLISRAGDLQQLAVSPDGRTLASSEEFGANIRLWDPRDGHSLGPPLSGHTSRIVSICFAPDSKTLVSAGWDGRLGFWDAKAGKNLAFLRGHNNYFNWAALSPDGGTVATCGDDTTVRLWNVARRQEIAVLQGHTDVINDLAFSADGQWLASASNDGTVRLWPAPRVGKLAAAAQH
jgi:WD40 repeat protein/predicted Ser/Thr protein kinase